MHSDIDGTDAVNVSDGLSNAARHLWAKSDYGEGESWLPLFMHMHDANFVAEKLWDNWLPKGLKISISRALGTTTKVARRVGCFLAAAHDLGKATPAFQAKTLYTGSIGTDISLRYLPEKAGFRFQMGAGSRTKLKHATSSALIMERYLSDKLDWTTACKCSWSSVLGSHHGTFPRSTDLNTPDQYVEDLGWRGPGSDLWMSAQFELISYAEKLSGLTIDQSAAGLPEMIPAQVASAFAGLVIMADWISSNQDLFPLVPIVGGLKERDNVWWEQRTEEAWADLDLLPAWRASEEAFDLYQFAQRFALPENATPRPIQRDAIEIAASSSHLGLMIIEAPMGEGKTEAALAAAELLARDAGRGGVCVALPTMATTDAMFSRVHEWLDRLPKNSNGPSKTMYLAHGKAGLNEEFQGVLSSSHDRAKENSPSYSSVDIDNRAVACDWLQGRKKGMLANFTVCTVDQVLMGALEMKHLPLRQLALDNKVVIIDECHAYDAYMQQYLKRVIEWLASLSVPVVLLSATLPEQLRNSLADSYVRGSKAREPKELLPQKVGWRERRKTKPSQGAVMETVSNQATGESETGPDLSYPLITYTDASGMHSFESRCASQSVQFEIQIIDDEIESLVGKLKRLLESGGCAGVICDTVTRAQDVYRALVEEFGESGVMLDHARFCDLDRMKNEERIRRLLGPDATRSNGIRPERLIVVGTQVMEQSLDIDFDVMVSDIAPIDLLLQRMGRLHRHKRGDGEAQRPKPLRQAKVFIRGIEELTSERAGFARGIERVYERASLLECLAVLRIPPKYSDGSSVLVALPDDIAYLVRTAYSGAVNDLIPASWSSLYDSAKQQRVLKWAEKENRAKPCLLPSIKDMIARKETLADIGNADIDNQDADAGPRAVRDTQETVEVMLARKEGKDLYLLPWIGDEARGVSFGQRVPTEIEPPTEIARVLSRSTVRLPLSLCRADQIDKLIGELEKKCGPYVGSWMGSPWLSGSLVLMFDESENGRLESALLGREISYSRNLGLSVDTVEEGGGDETHRRRSST